MTGGSMNRIQHHQVVERRRSIAFSLAFLGAMLVVLGALVIAAITIARTVG